MKDLTASLPPALVVPPPKSARKVARGIGVFLLLFVVAALLAPWQQTASGAGRVVAFSPDQRQQGIEAPVRGRVKRWLVREGSRVKVGDPLVELMDNDANLMTRLAEERAAIQLRLATQEARVATLRDRLGSLRQSQRAQGLSAQADVEVAQQDVNSARQALTAELAEKETNDLNLSRQRELQQEGLASQRELELAELAARRSNAAVASARAAVQAARSRLASREASLQRIEAAAQADIHDASARLQEAETGIASTRAALTRLDVGISRQAAQTVEAPVDGTILRILKRQGGEQVSQGEPLALLVPRTNDRAVELYVDGNDAALIQRNSKVRLQFEGWPAVQFSGWPSVAVGTFGGQVAFVDASDDGKGNFRVLVVRDGEEEPWPHPRFLRQGVRAKGWFLLNEVKLGREIWRRFNGFPPTTTPPPGAKGEV